MALARVGNILPFQEAFHPLHVLMPPAPVAKFKIAEGGFAKWMQAEGVSTPTGQIILEPLTYKFLLRLAQNALREALMPSAAGIGLCAAELEGGVDIVLNSRERLG